MLKKIFDSRITQAVFIIFAVLANYYVDMGQVVKPVISWIFEATCKPNSFCTPALALGMIVAFVLLLAYSLGACGKYGKIAASVIRHGLAIVTLLIVLYFFMVFSDLQHIIWSRNGVTPIWLIVGFPPFVIVALYAAWFYLRRRRVQKTVIQKSPGQV